MRLHLILHDYFAVYHQLHQTKHSQFLIKLCQQMIRVRYHHMRNWKQEEGEQHWCKNIQREEKALLEQQKCVREEKPSEGGEEQRNVSNPKTSEKNHFTANGLFCVELTVESTYVTLQANVTNLYNHLKCHKNKTRLSGHVSSSLRLYLDTVVLWAKCQCQHVNMLTMRMIACWYWTGIMFTILV